MSAIPCPRCHGPLQPGARMCAACGGPALVERAEGEDKAACAVHPTRLASAPCARCGVFGCATCLVLHGNSVLCRKCRPAPRIAWEDPELGQVKGFAATLWAFITNPSASASEVKSGSIGRAWVFAALCFIPQVAAWAATTKFGDAPGSDPLALAGTAVIVALGWLLVLPFGEFLTLRALGVRVPLSTQLRITAYSSAAFIVPWCSCYGLVLWGPWVRLGVLRSAFGLSWGQALIAVTALPVMCVCAVVATRADLPFWA